MISDTIVLFFVALVEYFNIYLTKKAKKATKNPTKSTVIRLTFNLYEQNSKNYVKDCLNLEADTFAVQSTTFG